MRDKLSARRESSQIQFLRVQSMREAIASRLTSDDNDRLARAKRGADEPGDLVEEESIVHVELHGVCPPTSVESDVRNGTKRRPSNAWSTALARSE